MNFSKMKELVNLIKSNCPDKTHHERRKIVESISIIMSYEEMVYKDPISLLYNRKYLDELLKHKSKRKYSVIAIDIDGFKSINDDLGHDIGDKILRKIGYIINGSIRANEGDIGFRVGGDEFLILLPNNGETDLTDKVINRIKEKIQFYSFGKDKKRKVKLSFGINKIQGDSSLGGALVKADKNLRINKTDGGKLDRIKELMSSLGSDSLLEIEEMVKKRALELLIEKNSQR